MITAQTRTPTSCWFEEEVIVYIRCPSIRSHSPFIPWKNLYKSALNIFLTSWKQSQILFWIFCGSTFSTLALPTYASVEWLFSFFIIEVWMFLAALNYTHHTTQSGFVGFVLKMGQPLSENPASFEIFQDIVFGDNLLKTLQQCMGWERFWNCSSPSSVACSFL